MAILASLDRTVKAGLSVWDFCEKTVSTSLRIFPEIAPSLLKVGGRLLRPEDAELWLPPRI